MTKILVFLIVITLFACTTQTGPTPEPITDGAPQHIPVNIAQIPDAIPRYEPRSPSVNPESYQVLGKRYHVLADSKNYIKRGIASWYGNKFHGKKTANGETYDMFAMTAAHKTLPIPSYTRVTNLQNQRSVVVRINDRGPFHNNRIIDLSYTAAVKLGIQQTGTGFVEVRSLEPGQAKMDSSANVAQTIYLQVGAFNNQINALELKNKINAVQQTNTRILSSPYQGNLVYKLQLGPIRSVDEADQMNQQLAKIGITKTHFIIEKSVAEQ